MAYDVYVVAAKSDRDTAKLLTRRLRALKMKVFYDATDEDDTFTSKEARKLERSDMVLVLWSAAALDSDEVRAAASQGYSNKDQPLVQVTLDGTVPYEPFSAEPLHSVEGLTTRTTPEGWYKAVETLGGHQGRKDLRPWMDFKTSEKDAKAAWIKAHPKDPIALAQAPKPVKPAPAKTTPAQKDVSETKTPAASPAAALTGAATAGLAAAGTTANTPSAEVVRESFDEDVGGVGWGMLLPVLLGILAMLWLAWFLRTGYTPSATPYAAAETVITRTCPPGQIPASMLNILEPSGSIAIDE